MNIKKLLDEITRERNSGKIGYFGSFDETFESSWDDGFDKALELVESRITKLIEAEKAEVGPNPSDMYDLSRLDLLKELMKEE